MVMKKMIKLDDPTIELLIDLKDRYSRQYPDEDVTYNLVINCLISENKNRKVEADNRAKHQQDSYEKLQSGMVNQQKEIRDLHYKLECIETDLAQIPYNLGSGIIGKYFKNP